MFGGNFDRDFARRARRADRFSKFVMGFIIFTFVMVVIGWIVMGWIAVNMVDKVEAEGLKPMIERMWCGPKKPECLSKAAP